MNARMYQNIANHIVFSTKQRSIVITIDMMKRLRIAFNEKAVSLGFTMHISNGHMDHVNLLVSATPKLSVSYIVKNLKGYSSYKIPGLYWQRVCKLILTSSRSMLFYAVLHGSQNVLSENPK